MVEHNDIWSSVLRSVFVQVIIAKARKDGNDKKVAIAMHCNLRPPDVALVVPGFNYEARNASAYNFKNASTSVVPYGTSLSNFDADEQCAAELSMIWQIFPERGISATGVHDQCFGRICTAHSL